MKRTFLCLTVAGGLCLAPSANAQLNPALAPLADSAGGEMLGSALGDGITALNDGFSLFANNEQLAPLQEQGLSGLSSAGIQIRSLLDGVAPPLFPALGELSSLLVAINTGDGPGTLPGLSGAVPAFPDELPDPPEGGPELPGDFPPDAFGPLQGLLGPLGDALGNPPIPPEGFSPENFPPEDLGGLQGLLGGFQNLAPANT